jgi:hypothetical protein
MARRKPEASIGSRAATRAKVDIAFVPRLPVWRPDWELIEKAWSRTVPPPARDEIALAVGVYLRDESLVRAAPFKDDVRKKLAHLRKAAETFARAIAVFNRGPGADEAGARLRPLLPVAIEDQKWHLDKMAREADSVALASALAIDELDGKPLPKREPELDLNAVAGRALSLLTEESRDDPTAANDAIKRALTEARAARASDARDEDTRPDDDDIDGFFDVSDKPAREWAAWDRLMIDLRKISVKYGLYKPIDRGGISDDDKPDGGVFVAAVEAIELSLPPGFARPHESRNALAQAILRATAPARH